MIFKFHKPSKAAHAYRAGMTLIEALSVIGILSGVLIVLLPAAARFQQKTNDVVCTSNLRQIGMGIRNYTFDNAGMLPGPLYIAQYPYRNGTDQLSLHLVDYLAVNKRSTKDRIDVFVCPAYRKAVKRIGDGPVYMMNVAVSVSESSSPAFPFGYANSTDSRTFGTTKDYPPLKITQLSNLVDEEGFLATTKTWAMKDIDQEEEGLKKYQLGVFSTFPKKKVHGDHRNALFYDFHVEAVDHDSSP